jgi:ParB-like chromosome segregation protein Spo0J
MSERRLIADIRVPADRVRKDLGDVAALAASLDDVGLIQPVVVTPENVLVAGVRRLEAAKRLGWPEIDVHVVADLVTAALTLTAERDENTCRKDFTPMELVAVGRQLEALERPIAKERQLANLKNQTRCAETAQRAVGRTRKIVADALGVGTTTYDLAKKVAKAAEDDPAAFGDLRDRMEATGKVAPVYKELVRRQAGEAASADPDPPTQPEPSAEPSRPGPRGVGVRWANEAIDCLKRIPKDDPLRGRAFQIVSDWIRHYK